ncbi:MAG: hypothetical protein AAF702_44590 [Chloroflexota bacterium]
MLIILLIVAYIPACCLIVYSLCAAAGRESRIHDAQYDRIVGGGLNKLNSYGAIAYGGSARSERSH